MKTQTLNIFLIEDNPGDADLINETFSEINTLNINVSWQQSLESFKSELNRTACDIIILDLGLPDSQGLATLKAVRKFAPGIPVIVLTGNDDDILAIKAVKQGAQDYLVKGQITTNSLSRSISYSFERHRLITELEASKAKERRLREIQALENVSAKADTKITAKSYGIMRLSESAPEVFQEYVLKYNNLLDIAANTRLFKTTNTVFEEVKKISEELGYIKVGPRDIIDIHREAMTTINKKADAQKAEVINEEARFILIQLMGGLVNFYRNFFTISYNNDIKGSQS